MEESNNSGNPRSRQEREKAWEGKSEREGDRSRDKERGRERKRFKMNTGIHLKILIKEGPQ